MPPILFVLVEPRYKKRKRAEEKRERKKEEKCRHRLGKGWVYPHWFL